jgi:hypothetical protein
MLRLAAAQNVWSQHLLERIQCEWFGLESPRLQTNSKGVRLLRTFRAKLFPVGRRGDKGRSRVKLGHIAFFKSLDENAPPNTG